ncbi:MAG: putative Ig domain-containing protein [Acidimicrobiales bacterium]
MAIDQSPAFTADTPPATDPINTAYGPYTFTASGFPAPTFTVTSGALPTGLSLNSTSGVLSGTPTVGGPFTFQVTASNGVAPPAVTPNIRIDVLYAPTSFSADNPPSPGLVGTAYGPYSYVANGDPAPTYAVSSGSLPPGLSLSSAGVLSGTPTGTGGSYTFVVTATNSQGSFNGASNTIQVNAVPVFTADSPSTSANICSLYTNYTFVATGTPVPTYAVTSGSLPPGLNLNGTSGVLSGLPNLTGSYTFVVTATNAVGSAPSPSITIVVSASSTPGCNNSGGGPQFDGTVIISGSGMAFGDVHVGSTSNSQTVTITNMASSPLNIGSLAVGGPFNIVGGTCATLPSLTTLQSCSIMVDFSPVATGPVTAGLDVIDNAASSPQVITLTGTGF